MKKPWLIPFIAVIIGMMALQMSSLGFSPLLPAIQKDFHASYTQIGLFTGVYGLVAIVLSVPAGFLARNYGEKSVLSTGLVIVAIGLFILSRAHDFTLGMTGRVVWLIGYRLSFVCVMIAIALTAPPRLKGSTMGILGSLSSLASVVGAPFGSRIEQVFGWRGAIAAFGGMALLGLIVFALFYRRSSGELPAPAHGVPRSTGSRPAYKEPVVWILAGTLGLLNIGGFTMTFFVPAVAQSVFHLRAMDGALMISTAYITAMFANLLCGFLADRVNRWTVMIGIAALLIPSSLAMLSSNLLVFRIGVAMLVALGLSATNQGYAITGAVLEGRETGPAMGIVSLGAGVYAYMGPQAIGILRDATGAFTMGFVVMSIAATIALVAMIAMQRSVSRRKFPIAEPTPVQQ
jgi:predicted MFS family arabinose efflux permease